MAEIEGVGWWPQEWWMEQWWPNPYWHLDTLVDIDAVHSGQVRLALNRRWTKKKPKPVPLDYWRAFAAEVGETPVPDDVVVLLPGEEPPAPPAQPKPRRRKKPAPVVIEPPKKDQTVINRRDIADLFALLGIVEEPKPDDEQDMTDILGVIGILETQ